MSAVLPLPLPPAPFRMIPRPQVIGAFPSHEIHNGAPITLVIAQQAQFQRDLAARTYPALPSPEQEIPRSIRLLPFGVCPSDEDADEVLDDVFRVPDLESLKVKCKIRQEMVLELLRNGLVGGRRMNTARSSWSRRELEGNGFQLQRGSLSRRCICRCLKNSLRR